MGMDKPFSSAGFSNSSSGKSAARLDRLYDRIGRKVPVAAGFLNWIRRPSARLLRLPAGLLLMVGGLLSFLPILGIWMLPLGLMLLAIDIPALQTPIAGIILRGERWWALRQRRKRQARAKATPA